MFSSSVFLWPQDCKTEMKPSRKTGQEFLISWWQKVLYIWKYILKHSINHTDSIITCFSYFDTWNLSWKFRHFLWCDANQVVRKFPASVIPRNFTYIIVTFSIFTLWRCRNWSYTTISCPSPHGRYTCLWNWTKFLLRTKPLRYEVVIIITYLCWCSESSLPKMIYILTPDLKNFTDLYALTWLW